MCKTKHFATEAAALFDKLRDKDVLIRSAGHIGTPGTGKSTLAQQLEEQSDLQHVNVSEIAKENNYFDGYDDERKCPILDEDRLYALIP
ncbi:hypothetical protein Avbf_04951 [Armadillidium vulgare]|nr:hypothetical protein Avbf_04951 [Armadillidium vulgare]